MVRICRCVALLALAAVLASCTGTTDSSNVKDPPPAIYSGLPGQQVAILVWADFATRTEFNQIQLDTTRLLTQKLEVLAAKPIDDKSKSPVLAGSQFLHPGTVVRYQREHPEVWALPVAEVAPRLGVPRVIFIEFEQFQVQRPEAPLLLRGAAKVNLKVLEIADKKARVTFEESGLEARHPKDAPDGVVMSDKYTLRSVYEKTLGELTDKIALRFIPENK